MLVFALLVVRYAPSPTNSLQISKRNGWELHFQFQGEASLFSDRSSPERDALLLVADERVTRSILTTAPLEDHSRVAHRKPDFMFEDATNDTD